MNVATQTKVLYEGHPVLMTKFIKSCHHPTLQLERPQILIIRELHFFRNANDPTYFPTSHTQILLGGFSKVKLHYHLPQDFLAETKTSRSSYISIILQMVTTWNSLSTSWPTDTKISATQTKNSLTAILWWQTSREIFLLTQQSDYLELSAFLHKCKWPNLLSHISLTKTFIGGFSKFKLHHHLFLQKPKPQKKQQTTASLNTYLSSWKKLMVLVFSSLLLP